MNLLKRGGVALVFLLGLVVRIDPAVAEDLTTSIQTGRMTVMEINKDARRIVCMNSQGRVQVHKVTNEAVVVTDDKTTTGLASLDTGDVIKAELRSGRIQKIVVLRHAWHEAAGMEQ
jgi:orotate phosphoribosyltransferase